MQTTFLTWGIGAKSALIRFFSSMNSFLMANERVLLTEATIALLTLRMKLKWVIERQKSIRRCNSTHGLPCKAVHLYALVHAWK